MRLHCTGAGSEPWTGWKRAQDFRFWANANGLDIINGRCVVEARIPGAGKEEALRWVAAATAAKRVIYCGDDTTDFGPLRFASQHGRALFVASDEREAPDAVTTVSSLAELLPILRAEVML